MEEEIDLREMILTLWNRKWIIVVCTIICVIGALLKFTVFDNLKATKETKNNISLFYSESTFVIGTNLPQESNVYRVTIDSVLLSTYSSILKSRTSLNEVINELNLDITPIELENQIFVTQKAEGNVLSVIVAYKDKEKSLEIADLLVEKFAINVNRIYDIDNAAVLDRAYELSSNEVLNYSEVSEIEPIIIEEASNLKQLKYILIVAFIGFALSSGVIFALEVLDISVKNEDDVEKVTQTKVLGSIALDNEDNSEIFAMLKTRLGMNKTMIITSAEQDVGKSYIALNLAKEFSKTDKNCLLIDLTSNESNLVKNYAGKGLTDYIEDTSKNIDTFISKTNIKNMKMMLIGKKNDEFIDETKVNELIKELEGKYDHIVIDSRNILDNADTLKIVKAAKETILVSKERKTKIDGLGKAKKSIETVEGKLVGNILVK